MGEVTTVVEAQTKNGVSMIQKTQIYCHICTCPRVWLHVGVVGTEKLLDAFNGNALNIVNNGVTAVIALAGVTLAVLVGEQ